MLEIAIKSFGTRRHLIERPRVSRRGAPSDSNAQMSYPSERLPGRGDQSDTGRPRMTVTRISCRAVIVD